ncbi:MAG TPA: hypothetical protein VJ873_02865, partial [bacterium]|nr:hypothetical protein [bacterium]
MFRMFSRRLLATLAFMSLTVSLRAQDAHSMAIGGAATAAPMGLFGIYWNPAILAVPDSAPSGWDVGSGFSAFDTSNSGKPIVHFQPSDALGSSQDPIQRFQQYLGLFGVKYFSTEGGVVYNQELDYLASQGALQFFNDRNKGAIGVGSSYNLNYQQTNQQVTNLELGYGMQMPLGTIQMFTVGGTFKYHDGLQYEQDTLTGTYHQLTPGSGYTYTKTTSSSGLGLSIDGGFLAKFTDALSLGMMFENISSNFTWQATQQNYQLDGAGNESPVGPPQSVSVSAPFPYAVKLGVLFSPPDKDIGMEAQITWSQHQARWRAGLERFYPDAHILMRLGTFADEISNQQMWSFGIGYVNKNVAID